MLCNMKSRVEHRRFRAGRQVRLLAGFEGFCLGGGLGGLFALAKEAGAVLCGFASEVEDVAGDGQLKLRSMVFHTGEGTKGTQATQGTKGTTLNRER